MALRSLTKNLFAEKSGTAKTKKIHVTDNNQFNNHFSYKFCPKFLKYSNNKILGQ